jgi:hypothetical protein
MELTFLEILSAAHDKNKIKNYNRLSRKIVRVNRRTRERAVELEEHDAQKDLKFINHPTCTPFLCDQEEELDWNKAAAVRAEYSRLNRPVG